MQPEPPFPFSNCFFWFRSSMIVRVKRKVDGGYDDTKATRLSVREHVALLVAWRSDSIRSAQIQRDAQRSRLSGYTIPADSFTSDSPAQTSSSPSIKPQPLLPHRPQIGTPSAASETPSAPSIQPTSAPSNDSVVTPSRLDMHDSDQVSTASTSSSDDLRSYNLFGWDPDPSFAFLPLLEASVELEKYIELDEIGNPTDFYKEQDAISGYAQLNHKICIPLMLTCAPASSADSLQGEPSADRFRMPARPM